MLVRWVKAVAFGGLVDQTLNLRPGMNVVVGPNESGKSTWHAALFAAICGRSEELETTEDSEFDRKPWHVHGWAVEAMLDRDNDDPVQIYQDLLNPDSSTATALTGPHEGGRHDVSPSLRYHGGLDTTGWVGLDRHSYAATAWVQQGSGRNELSEAVALCIREADAVRACERIERLRRRHTGDDTDATSPLGRAELDVVERSSELKELKDLTEQHERASASLGQWSAFAYSKEQELIAAELADAQYRVVELQGAVRKQAGDPFVKPVLDSPETDDDTDAAVIAAEGRLRAAEHDLVSATVAAVRPDARVLDEPERGAVAVAEMPSVVVDTEFAPRIYGSPRRGGRWRALRQPDGRALVVAVTAVIVVAVGVGLAALRGSLALGASLAAIGVGLAVVAVVIGLRSPVREDQAPVSPAPGVGAGGPGASTVELDDSRVHDARLQLVWALGRAGYGPDVDTVENVLAQFHRDRDRNQRVELERRAREQVTLSGLEEQLAQAQDEVARLAQRVDPNAPHRASVNDLAQARSAYESATRERDRALHARDAAAAKLANRLSVGAAEQALAEARQRLNSLRRLNEVLDEAYGYLSRSGIGARREIASALETALGRSLPHITDGRYPHVTIGTDFRIRISDPAEPTIDPMRGARSTREQTYLSARVALGEHLSRRRRFGPLILDDVTSSADTPRVHGLLDLLYRFAQVRQVIVFAHEEAVADWATRMMTTHSNVHLSRLTTTDESPREVRLSATGDTAPRSASVPG